MTLTRHAFGTTLAVCAAVCSVVGLVALCYWPYFRVFIGTDLGVYWEVSRRWCESGRLSLLGNYWDHKPPAVYLALLPWHGLGHDGAEFLGLKIGTLLIYAASFAGILVAILIAARDLRPWRILGVSGLVAAAAAISLDARLDAAQNGIAAVAALTFEGAGLVAMGLALRRTDRRMRIAAVVAGVLLASAPFWRPTSIVGGGLLALIASVGIGARLVNRRWPTWMSGVVWTLGAASATAFAWLLLVIASGSSIGDFIFAVLAFNTRYGTYFRSITPIGEYFRQENPACDLFRLAAAASAVLMVLGFRWRNREPTSNSSQMECLCAAVYLLLAVLVAAATRKIQSFYVFQFVLPALFVGAYAVARIGSVPWRWWPAAAGWGLSGLLAWQSWMLVWPIATRNDFASNARMQTGFIVELLTELDAGQGVKRLWVCGNRAPLYSAAARSGIRPYDWTVYDTPVYAVSREEFDRWWLKFAADPPEFIVRLGNAQNTPWEARDEFRRRAGLVNALLAEQYDVVPTPPHGQNTWPYGYVFSIHTLRQ
ncbi:MAG: hypothetical protein JNK25_12015 [Phycisphaerae bacterium]|nr:hypothetical protein [Phycisphaerae bacterium]